MTATRTGAEVNLDEVDRDELVTVVVRAEAATCAIVRCLRIYTAAAAGQWSILVDEHPDWFRHADQARHELDRLGADHVSDWGGPRRLAIPTTRPFGPDQITVEGVTVAHLCGAAEMYMRIRLGQFDRLAVAGIAMHMNEWRTRSTVAKQFPDHPNSSWSITNNLTPAVRCTHNVWQLLGPTADPTLYGSTVITVTAYQPGAASRRRGRGRGPGR